MGLLGIISDVGDIVNKTEIAFVLIFYFRKDFKSLRLVFCSFR